MSRKFQILICDDDPSFHLAVKHTLKEKYHFRSAYNADEAKQILKSHSMDVLLLDIEMRTAEEGLQALPHLKELDPNLSIIMSSGKKDFATVRQALKVGALDYVPKDFNSNELECTLERVLHLKTVLQKNSQHHFEALNNQKRHHLIGKSQATQTILKMIDRIRPSNTNVVITGETGTGKEVVARLLRPTLPDGTLAPFVAVDSATIQSSTAESLLFGHEKGAFTGADRTTKGIFEEAHGGVVYFDEIANMPLDIQAKLLRILQEKELTRMGSMKPIPLEFRVICATNKDLDGLVKTGQFKDDLLQRLSVIPIHLPPLRERPEDLPLLIEHFLKENNYHQGKFHFTDETVQFLQKYSWPGNVRELKNLIAYLLTLVESTEVEIADLPLKIRDQVESKNSKNQSIRESLVTEINFYKRVQAYEKEILSIEFQKCNGNISRMALQLGMDRSHLYTKLREHSLHPAQVACPSGENQNL